MRTRQGKSVSIGAAIAVGMVLFGGVAAFADNSSHSFSGVVPPYQQAHYLNVIPALKQHGVVDDRFLVDLKQSTDEREGREPAEQRGVHGDQGHRTGSNTSIPNSTPAGDESRLVVTNYDWNTLSPNIAGLAGHPLETSVLSGTNG